MESVLALVFIGVAAITGVIYGGPVGALVFLACWIFTGTPVYYWNKARKVRRAEAYDDRLTDERMAKGREEVISGFEKQRQDEAAEESSEIALSGVHIEDDVDPKS
jgi:hypothetical protein